MRHVFANRVRVCVFRLLFLLAGFSVTPFAFANIDPGDVYCSTYMGLIPENQFDLEFKISFDSYESGWEAPAYMYLDSGQYRCEMIRGGQLDVCYAHEDDVSMMCEIGYKLTGRKFRGSNPWYGTNNTQDPSLNPSNPYIHYDGTFNRGMNCSEGEHIYTPFPKGYRYVPFDGFKYYSTDAWSSCIFDVAMSILQSEGWATFTSVVKFYRWSKEYYSSYKHDCSSLEHACLYIVMDVRPLYIGENEGEFYYDLSDVSLYARCPPNSQFSPVHGACYVVEVDELLAGTGISEADLYGQVDAGANINVNFNSVNLLSQISKPGIDVCPSPLTTTFRGQTITFFDYTDACQMLGDYVRPFVLLLGGFISIAIVLGISTASATSNEG